MPGSQSLTVAFTAGDNGGATVDYYEYSIDNGATWHRTAPDTISSPLVITGLSNNTSYSVKIRAHNGVGSGTGSSSISATPVTPELPPTGLDTPGAFPVALVMLAVGVGAVLVAGRTRTRISKSS